MLKLNTLNFTAEQIEQIAYYRHKWEQIARSRIEIDREQATLAVNEAYKFIDLPEPNIIFFSKPDRAFNYLYQEITANWGKLENTSFGKPVAGDLIDRLLGNIRKEVTEEILRELQGDLDNGLANNLALEISDRLSENQIFSIIFANFRAAANSSAQDSNVDELSKIIFDLFFETGFIFNNYISPVLWQITNLFNSNRRASNSASMFAMVFTGGFGTAPSAKYQLPLVEATSRFSNTVIPSLMADFAYYIDYCHEVLGCDREPIKWNIFADLIINCGWLFPYEKTVLICDRQTAIN